MNKTIEKKSILFRLDAGVQYGYGHLSRCIALANEFNSEYEINILIRSDDNKSVEGFIEAAATNFRFNSVHYLAKDMSEADDLLLITKLLNSKNTFLVLDHYSITEQYQKILKDNFVKWLQFDSHANQKFYGDLVLHASPSAKVSKYEKLVVYDNTKLLLGLDYVIVNKKFINKRQEVTPRKRLKDIFICFGGGEDKGASLKCLEFIEEEIFEHINIHLFTNNKNRNLNKIRTIESENSSVHVTINNSNVETKLAECDLAIIAPGTLSYEAATMGVPMLLVTIADNQQMNAKGWSELNCGINLGEIQDLDEKKLNENILQLKNQSQNLAIMSKNCLKAVDGRGAKRVKEEISNIL